jgi:hypothetical protein
LTESPSRGERGWQDPVARAERSGAGAFLLEPLGGYGDKARRSIRSSALPSRQGAGTWPGSPVAGGGSPAAQRPFERGCTDRSAGGCADWYIISTGRAQAWPGRRGGSASAACAVAEPWTTVAWALGPRDRTTLPLSVVGAAAHQPSRAQEPCHAWRGHCAPWLYIRTHGMESGIGTAVALSKRPAGRRRRRCEEV